jgi:hypothetical protein
MQAHNCTHSFVFTCNSRWRWCKGDCPCQSVFGVCKRCAAIVLFDENVGESTAISPDTVLFLRQHRPRFHRELTQVQREFRKCLTSHEHMLPPTLTRRLELTGQLTT